MITDNSKTKSPLKNEADQITEISNHTITDDTYKAAFRNHPGGVAVITADAGDGPVGLTATSVSSVNIDPPLLMFSASALSSSTPTILRANTVIVHLLAADQLHLAQLCSTSGIDRFEDTSLWSRLPTGEPLYHTTPTWIRGRIVNTMDAGGSTVVAVQAIEASVSAPANDSEDRPLVYNNRTWHVLGTHSKI